MMRKKIAISVVVFALFIISFFSFHHSYKEMQYYTMLTKRSVIAAKNFNELSRQINNAAILYPTLLERTDHSGFSLFYTDSVLLSRELQKLNAYIMDTMNARIAARLDILIRAELSWILKSNVPDSILMGCSQKHLEALNEIDALMKEGIKRSDYLLQFREEKLNNSVRAIEWKVGLMLGMACVLVLAFSIGLFTQRDKTQEKEKELEKQEKRFRAMIEHNQDPIVLMSASGKILYRSPAIEKITGYSNEERGKYLNTDAVHPDDEPKIKEYLKDMVGHPGKVIFASYRIKHKLGHFIWVEGTFSSLFHDPAIRSCVINVKDISERKASEEKLIASEKRFRETLDNIMEGVQMIGFDWRYIYVNEALAKYSEYPVDNMIGKTVMELYPGVEQTRLYALLKICMEERKGSSLESEFVFPDGTMKYFDLSIHPVPEGIFILSVDISERKKAEEEVAKLNRLYAFISDINQSIVHIEEETTLFNKACDIAINTGGFKLARIEIIGQDGKLIPASSSFSDKGMEDVVAKIENDYATCDDANTPVQKTLRSGKYEFNNDMQNDPDLQGIREALQQVEVCSGIALPIRRSGQMVAIFTLSSSQPGFFDQREIGILEEAASDISFAIDNFEKARLHRITEQRVIHNEKRFRSLIEKSKDMKTLTNSRGFFVYGSPSVFKTFEYTEKEFLNTPVVDFFHPDDLPDLLERREIILATPGASFNFQYRALHKKGHWIWIEGTLTNLLHEPSVNALVSNFRDISEKKNAEEQKEKLNSDLVRYSKNLEQFAYVVSHNLRSPIANILGLSNILQGELSANDRKRSQEFLYNAVEQLDITVKDLNKILEVRSGASQNRERVNLPEVIDAIKVSIATAVLNQDIAFDMRLEITVMNAIKSYVHSILYNLITNSIKYRRKDVALVIRIHSFIKDDKFYLVFSDNGTGLNLAQHGTKIFGLYQRFHLDISGKGMGLFMVKTQVESMEGNIGLKSNPGEGVEFTMEFPLHLVQ